jgi:hypothetical protein
MVMSRTLQWVIGISVVVVSLAIVFAVFVPWVSTWFGWGRGYGMIQAPAPWAGVSPYGMMGGQYGTSSGGSGMMGSGSGMMGGAYGSGRYGMMGGTGMMPWLGSAGNPKSTDRLSLDQARTVAGDYASSAGADFAVAEVMEFENNFYAAIEEMSTGRGAFELLIDPYTGAVGPEPGPNMMWNDKYGHMSYGVGGENQLSMEQARGDAQQALESQIPGALVHEDGTSFYGYYTFDFDGPDGAIGGMMSVNADNGSAWLHTWHGDFIGEWESEEATS